MQSGIYFGYVGLVEGIVARIQAEFGGPLEVVATGGLAPLFHGGTPVLQHLDQEITTRGLIEIYRRNRAETRSETDRCLHADKRDELLFLALGGAGEIGMNLNLYGHAGKWLMVDLGITFGDESTPGVDVIMPDISFISERRERPGRPRPHPRA